MKHTLKAKYAADGLSAHRQRLTAQPAVVKAMRDKVTRGLTLAKITARLKSDGRPKETSSDCFDMAVMKAFRDRMDKFMVKKLAAYKPVQFTAADISQIKGLRADVLILNDMIDALCGIPPDALVAAAYTPPRSGMTWNMGFDFAKPSADFGVIQVNATC